MTTQELQEYNKMCAEFLGYSHPIMDKDFYFVDKQNYNEQSCISRILELNFEKRFYNDWNWIMEVLNKIAALDFGWKITSKYVNIYSHIGDPRGRFNCEFNINCPENVQLDAVRTINQFLIWYKNNK